MNIKDIEEELNLLKRDPSIENVEAELVRGTAPNLSVLLIEIEETSPYEAKLSFDNYRSLRVGEFQGTIETGYRNIIGVSDRAFAQYNLTEGFDAYSIGYAIPVNSKNATVSFEYRNGDSKIIEDFEEANIRAEADTISLGYRRPIVYSSQREVAFGEPIPLIIDKLIKLLNEYLIMAGRFEGLNDLEWKLFQDLFPKTKTKRCLRLCSANREECLIRRFVMS